MFIKNANFNLTGNQDVLIQEKKIIRIGKDIQNTEKDIFDVNGRLITPGLIDIHIQGAGGADVLDGTKQALEIISKTCTRYGTTGFLATTVFKPGLENKHLQTAAELTGHNLGGAHLLGTHLEGPFISLAKKGMIHSSCITAPSTKVVNQIYDYLGDTLKMMTIAPELGGAIPVIENLVSHNIIAAFAHSDANYQETINGFRAGINHVTHMYNAMRSVHHREPGPILAILENKDISAQLITDGVHLHPGILKFTYNHMGPERIIPITDGMQALGLPEGKYLYDGIEYTSKNGTARYHDGTLIGTASPLNKLLEKMSTFTGCSFVDAAKMASENPARLLGLDNCKGFIKESYDADLVIWNEDYTPYMTIIDGKIVYQNID